MRFSDLRNGANFQVMNNNGQRALRLDVEYIKVGVDQAYALTPRDGGCRTRVGEAVTIQLETPVEVVAMS